MFLRVIEELDLYVRIPLTDALCSPCRCRTAKADVEGLGQRIFVMRAARAGRSGTSGSGGPAMNERRLRRGMVFCQTTRLDGKEGAGADRRL